MESKDKKLALMNIDRKGRPYLEVSLRSEDDKTFMKHLTSGDQFLFGGLNGSKYTYEKYKIVERELCFDEEKARYYFDRLDNDSDEEYVPFQYPLIYDPHKTSGFINGKELRCFIDGNMFETIENPDAIELGFKKVIQINLVDTSPDCRVLDELQQSKEQFKFEIYDGTTKLHTISNHALILTPPKFAYGKGMPERNYRILCPDLGLTYETH